MMTTATCNGHSTETHATEPGLFLAFGLREKAWKLGFTSGHGQKLREQMAEWEAERRAMLHTSQEAPIEQVWQLMHRRGIGINGAEVLVMEFFGGRAFKNRREVGGLAGVIPGAADKAASLMR
jgi:hypothetical protein